MACIELFRHITIDLQHFANERRRTQRDTVCVNFRVNLAAIPGLSLLRLRSVWHLSAHFVMLFVSWIPKEATDRLVGTETKHALANNCHNLKMFAIATSALCMLASGQHPAAAYALSRS